jgi:hypothetical protein
LIFVGWFIGALIAEARVAHVAHGRVRAASLQPRRPQQYVSATTWALVPRRRSSRWRWRRSPGWWACSDGATRASCGRRSGS